MRECSAETAVTIARELAQMLSWDDEAGEAWGRVLWGEQAGIMICMVGPLIIMTPEQAPLVTAMAGHYLVIEVPSLDAGVLTCNPTVLHAAFGDQVSTNSELDTVSFSADELWFWTV